MTVKRFLNKGEFILIHYFLFSIILFMCGCGGDGTPTPQISIGNIQAPVEVRMVHGTVFVARIVVNGSIGLEMLVDTGASRTFVPAGLFGNPDGDVYISSLCFENSVCLNNFIAGSSNSAFTQSKSGYYNGIIGMDILKKFDLTFDYKSALLYFYDLVEAGPSEPVTLPIQYGENRPFTDVSVEGLPQGPTLLDTGSAYTRLTPIILDSLIQDLTVLFTSVVFNIGVSESVEYIPLTDYCAGMACPDEIIVQKGSWPAVGGTFLREFLTVFNFSENTVKLSRFTDNSHIKKSGIQRIGLQIDIYDASQIIYVIDGGLAWDAGLREGYEIISVNDIPIGSLGYFGIYDLMSDTSINEYQFTVLNDTGDVEILTISI